jgi:hypothetical protein
MTVDRIQRQIAQTALSICTQVEETWTTYSSKLNSVAKKVTAAVFPILYVASCLLLFTSQSSMFVIGGLVSVLEPNFMHTRIDRICQIWQSLSTISRAVAVAGGLIAFPITTALASFFMGGSVILKLIEMRAETPSQ